MSYKDPYSVQYAAGTSAQYHNSHAEPPQDYNSYPAHQTYDNMGGGEVYNPYTSSNTRAYRDERQPDEGQPDYNDYPPPQRRSTKASTSGFSKKKPSVAVVPVRKEASGFEQGEFTPAGSKVQKSRTPRDLREYRYDHQGNLWTKGGRGRCAGRVCCCTLMTTVFLIVSIVLALALWIRPPSISIGGVQTMTVNGTTIQQVTDGIQVNLGVNISVQNPNYFTVDFKKIDAQIFYPINDTPVGGGDAQNIIFRSHSETNFTFPFMLEYNSTADTGNKVILDLASKCGVGSSQKTNIVVNYKITLGIRILLVTISPVITNQFSFPCPLSASDISKFIGGS
ncbi:hypothetical protein BDZ97DRAFT_1914948 [Flammula alnicola]|nr:hypothetical protein BDZ97DRAFT_1914948 [Flammula alnicola]